MPATGMVVLEEPRVASRAMKMMKEKEEKEERSII